MPFCPKCNIEYEEGIETCTSCGEQLVPSLSENKTNAGAPDIDNAEAFLVSVKKGFDESAVEGSLTTAGIPFVKKGHSGPEGFARFDLKYASLGADFYVPPKLLKQAKAALPPLDGIIPESAEGDEEPDDSEIEETISETELTDDSQENARGSKSGILTAILFIIVAALVIFGVDFIMNGIRTMLGYPS